jgi:hypothetical protein
MRWLAGVGGLAFVSAVVACSSGAGTSESQYGGTGELGEHCGLDDYFCASQRCVPASEYYEGNSFCSKPCSTDRDCPQDLPVCGQSSEGEAVCLPSCSSDHEGFACVDGRPVACKNDGSQCEECGCPIYERCEPGVGCKSTIGERCTGGNTNCEGGICIFPDAKMLAGTCHQLCDNSCLGRCLATSNTGNQYCECTTPECED